MQWYVGFSIQINDTFGRLLTISEELEANQEKSEDKQQIFESEFYLISLLR